MIKKQAIQLFEERKVRTVWDDQEEKWYFSIVDVCGVLTDSKDPTAYWRKLKQRLKAEGNETVTNCHALKLRAVDGKMRMTDVADTEQLFRLINYEPHWEEKSPSHNGRGFAALVGTLADGKFPQGSFSFFC